MLRNDADFQFVRGILRRVSFRLMLSFVMIVVSGRVRAQAIADFSYSSYGLENDTFNVIQNLSHLDDFYESLDDLADSAKSRVSIIHIGDSHIQGDYLTQPMRRNFQQQFGNAGRGLIVPGKVAGTNESYNIVSSSDAAWLSKRCVFPDQPLAIGIGGITISSPQPDVALTIYMNDLWLDYSFNTATLFFQNDGKSYAFTFRDTTERDLAMIDPIQFDKNFGTVEFSENVSVLSLLVKRSTPQQDHATIFGLSLENNQPGVLYHSIGVNGAKYRHYSDAVFFAEQTAVLQPELIIISLGTNEALNYPFEDQHFGDHIDRLVNSLSRHNTDAQFILVTPPPAFRNRNRDNPGIENVRRRIISYAVENGLAFWDMYKVMGAEGGAARWRELGFLRDDGVHFTKEGYAYQANLFYAAILKGYNEYVLRVRP